MADYHVNKQAHGNALPEVEWMHPLCIRAPFLVMK